MDRTDHLEHTGRLWYVAYGSNLSADRFSCYLQGGRPAGCLRTYPGCRDRAHPVRSAPVMIDGGLVFCGPSSTWGGGTAVYDPDAGGRVAAMAYLLRPGQLADVLAQEMRRDPESDLDLGPLRRHGRQRFGPGRYETVLQVGVRDGAPMVTLTSDRRARGPLAGPTEAYLRTMATGLSRGHRWDADRIRAYLAAVPGARR